MLYAIGIKSRIYFKYGGKFVIGTFTTRFALLKNVFVAGLINMRDEIEIKYNSDYWL